MGISPKICAEKNSLIALNASGSSLMQVAIKDKHMSDAPVWGQGGYLLRLRVFPTDIIIFNLVLTKLAHLISLPQVCRSLRRKITMQPFTWNKRGSCDKFSCRVAQALRCTNFVAFYSTRLSSISILLTHFIVDRALPHVARNKRLGKCLTKSAHFAGANSGA